VLMSSVPTLIVNHDTLTKILLISSVINNLAVTVPLVLSAIPRVRRRIIKEILLARDALD